MVDRYTKCILTVIAASLVWLCFNEGGRLATAQMQTGGLQRVVIAGFATASGITPMIPVAIGDVQTGNRLLPVSVMAIGTGSQALPVSIAGVGSRDGTVPVTISAIASQGGALPVSIQNVRTENGAVLVAQVTPAPAGTPSPR
jgi:hypothetical protein